MIKFIDFDEREREAELCWTIIVTMAEDYLLTIDTSYVSNYGIFIDFCKYDTFQDK